MQFLLTGHYCGTPTDVHFAYKNKIRPSMSPHKTRPMVVMFANYPRGTGYAWWLMETYWDKISCVADQRGWKSSVVYPIEQSSDTSPNGMTIDHLANFLSSGKLVNLASVYKLIRENNIRSLYLTDRPFRSWRYIFLRLFGVKTIVVHNHTPGDRPPVGGLKGLAKYLLNLPRLWSVDRVIAVSSLMAIRHIQNARMPESRVLTVTNGIKIRDLVENARRDLEKTQGFSPEDFLICSIGRLSPYKRFDFSILCLVELLRRNLVVKPRLIVVGDGPDRARLESLAAANSLREEVIFVGHVADPWAILCGVDVILHPSKGEGLSLAILEGMASETPVVVPNIPSVSQTITHGITGIVYTDNSMEEAGNLIAELSSNSEKRRTIGKQARQDVLNKYSLERAMINFDRYVIPILFEG